MITDIIVAFVASVLAGTGVGGGGLLVIYLSLFAHWEQLACQGANLLFFVVGSAASVPIHARKRNINTKTVLLLGIFGAVGAYFGLSLARAIDASALRYIFGAFLVFCGITALKRA